MVAVALKKKAERSADATRQISALVKAIQTDTQDAVAAMEGTRKKNPQNKHGVHSYKLEDFGLSLAQIRRDYGPYSQFFAIPEEGKTS